MYIYVLYYYIEKSGFNEVSTYFLLIRLLLWTKSSFGSVSVIAFLLVLASGMIVRVLNCHASGSEFKPQQRQKMSLLHLLFKRKVPLW